MLVNILLLIIGLVLIVGGANYLVDGSANIARKFGVSEFIIGLTIVGMGTSAPEMVVSFLGALKGQTNIAIGNVVGSNIFNTLLILGLTSIIMPIPITNENKKKDIPMNIFITLLMILMGMTFSILGIGSNTLSRFDGIILVGIFIIYLIFSLKTDKKEDTQEVKNQGKVWLSSIMIVGGLASLILGGKLFVDNATSLAKILGVSDKFVAITILAGGTSMPELATCLVAAIKKKGQLALGNILGSNIFNILLILGGSAIIHPLSFAGMNVVDMGVLLLSALLIWASIYIGKRNLLDRVDGAIMFCCNIAYLTWLFIKL